MPKMTVTITDIFTVLDKFITLKIIIIMIEICIFAPERIESFMSLFFSWSIKQTLDNSIHLNMMIILYIFKDILHSTSHSIIRIDVFLHFIRQVWCDKTNIIWIQNTLYLIIVWLGLFLSYDSKINYKWMFHIFISIG